MGRALQLIQSARALSAIVIGAVLLWASPAWGSLDTSLQGDVGGAWPTSGTHGPLLRFGAGVSVGVGWRDNALGLRLRLDTKSGLASGVDEAGGTVASLSLYYRRLLGAIGPQSFFATGGLGVTPLLFHNGDVGRGAWAPTLFAELGTAISVVDSLRVITGMELVYVSTLPYGNIGLIAPGSSPALLIDLDLCAGPSSAVLHKSLSALSHSQRRLGFRLEHGGLGRGFASRHAVPPATFLVQKDKSVLETRT